MRYRALLRASVAALAICSAVGLGAKEADAETLEEALARSYYDNPTLRSTRAELRGVDEREPPPALRTSSRNVASYPPVGPLCEPRGGLALARVVAGTAQRGAGVP